jgi:two-component system NtrC family sensor kinase
MKNSNIRLANRIFLSLLGIIVFGSFSAAIIGAILISNALKGEAFSRVENDLKSARLYLNDRLEELSIKTQLLAKGLEKEVSLPLEHNLSLLFNEDAEPATKELANTLYRSAGVAGNKSETGFVVISLEMLTACGFQIGSLQRDAICDDGKTLWLFSVSPGKRGTAFSGILLNGNTVLVKRLQEILFGSTLYGTKPFGTVTIFCGDRRVATTVIGPQGTIAVGTRVSDVVRRKVLGEGGTWLDRAYVVDDWYLSAYEPIKNPLDENVGILYVGILEQKYLDVRNRALLFLLGITIPTLGLLLFFVYLVSKSIVRPISELAQASQKIAGGKLDTKVVQKGHTSEFVTLLNSFNKMVNSIKNREKMLRRKNTQLEDANRDYQELLSFVTHELNNSIGSLLLNVTMLSDGTLGTLDDEQNEVVSLVLRDVERFREMVRNYLNISRLEKGTLKYNPETVDMRRDVVEPVVRRLQSRFDHRGLSLEWEWKQQAVVTVDTELMDICYSNLLINALKYGKDWIRITAHRAEKSWVFGVQNGGPPIPEDKIHLLFRKFSRLVKSDDGAGLGLYLVRKILEQHGGEVWCESGNGTGTAFFLSIPDTSKK